MQQIVSSNVANAIIPIREPNVAPRGSQAVRDEAVRQDRPGHDPPPARENARPKADPPRPTADERTDECRQKDAPRKVVRKRADGAESAEATGQGKTQDTTDFQAVLAEKLSSETSEVVPGDAQATAAVVQAAAGPAAVVIESAQAGEILPAELIPVSVDASTATAQAAATPDEGLALALENVVVGETTPAAAEAQQMVAEDGAAATVQPTDGIPLSQELTATASQEQQAAITEIKPSQADEADPESPGAAQGAVAAAPQQAETSGNVVRQTISRRNSAQGVHNATEAPPDPVETGPRPGSASPIHTQSDVSAHAAALRATGEALSEAQMPRRQTAETRTGGGGETSTQTGRQFSSVLEGVTPPSDDLIGVGGPGGRVGAAAPAQDVQAAAQLEDVPVVAQLTQALRAGGGQAGQQITVRLDPPELGLVRMILHDDGAALRGVVEVSNPRTYAELQQEMPGLAQRLADSGVDLRRIEVVLTEQGRGDLADADDSAGLNENRQGRQQGDQGEGQSAGEIEESPGAPGAAATSGAGANDYVGEESINVWI